jgi:hypothetical protein
VAGPTILVRVLGDLSNLSKSFSDTKNKAGELSAGVSSSIGQTLATLNKTGILGPFGESLATANEAFGELADKAHSVGSAMLGLGGAFVGVGTGLAILGSKDQAARQQLQAAIDATGKSWEDYSARVEEAIKHNEKFGDTAAQTQNALQILTQATGDPAKALQLLNTATDLAAAKHESLSEAATQLGKVYNGSTKLLKEFGIQVSNAKGATSAAAAATKAADAADKASAAAKQRLADLETIDAAKKKLTVTETVRLHDAQQKVTAATATATAAHQKAASAQTAAQQATKNQAGAVDQLSGKLKGQASAASDTFAGKIKALTTHIEDQAAAFGNKYGPALQVAGQGFAVLGGTIEAGRGILNKYREAQDAAKKAREGMTAAEEASIPFEWASLGPILLIIAAIAILAAAAYLIYRNWKTIWSGMKDAVKAVWDWIKQNWPLLVGILFGPIGIAAALIWKYWKYILDGLKVVWNWIRTAWGDVYHFVADPIVKAVDAVVNFFTGLPGKIAGITKGMWNGIANAFVDAINFIVRIWNDLHFKAPGFSVFGHHVGGFDIGLPHIPDVPHLAQGGLITQTGLVFAHAGEAITPAPTRQGPAVVFAGDNHFSSDIDIELFMRKAAWAVQTSGV